MSKDQGSRAEWKALETVHSGEKVGASKESHSSKLDPVVRERMHPALACALSRARWEHVAPFIPAGTRVRHMCAAHAFPDQSRHVGSSAIEIALQHRHCAARIVPQQGMTKIIDRLRCATSTMLCFEVDQTYVMGSIDDVSGSGRLCLLVFA